jgi:hypothetical protein
MKEKTEHNIFWSGGFDSTFLVCKRLIVDELPIETYYLNFPCDGYNKTFNKFPSTNFDKMMSNNTNVNIQDPWSNKKSYGRYSRFIEVEILDKLRKMIIKKFNHTQNLFPKTKLIEKFEIDKEVLNYSKRLANYNKRWERADQTLYMCQFSLDLDDKIEISYEADVSNPDGVTYSLATQLVRKNLDENLEVKLNSNIPEMRVYKNWVLPLAKTYRKEMIKIAKQYDFIDILKYTWSCRFPKENGDICDDCTLGVKEIERVNNYKDLLCMTI